MSALTAADLEPRLHELFIDAAGTALREEDKKKAIEVAALLNELARVGTSGALVDVAAGKSYVGLLAGELLGFPHVTVIERDAKQLANCRHAVSKLKARFTLDAHLGDVGDLALWPPRARVAVGLHACGPASDASIDAAIAREVKWLLLVPCCYSASLAQWDAAHRAADALGVPGDAELRKKFVQTFVDSERALRLEAAGYETEVVSFVAPTVTPHHLLFRARRLMSAERMARAASRRAKLLDAAR